MPSIFARNRRASDAKPADTLSSSPSGSPINNNKRRSIDLGRPPVSGGKFKNIFALHHDEGEVKKEGVSQGDDSKNNSLKKRLSTASQLFNKQPDSTTTSAAAPPTPQSANRAPEPTAGNDDSAVQTTPSSEFRFPSPTTAPENFTLSGTNSPEGGAYNARRKSTTWQPSYPLVLPDDSYADLAPDGHPANDKMPASSQPLPSENEHRRSMIEAQNKEKANGQIPTSGSVDPPHPQPVDPRKFLAANGQIPTPSPDEEEPNPHVGPPAGPTAPLTPPPSATTSRRPLEADNASSENGHESDNASEPTPKNAVGPVEATGSTSPSRPNLSVKTDSPERASSDLPPSTGRTESSGNTVGTASAPASAHPDGPTRPGAPSRRITHLQSPPMPQPIKNLPSMVGWPAFMKDPTPGTPGWGQINKEVVPRTPGWAGMVPRTPGWATMTGPMTGRIPSTPGGSGFPFSLPQTSVGQNKGKGRENLSEVELRKHRRAMPVMLRQPSTKPVQHEGGDVGASDDDDDDQEDTDTEVEGDPEDDSEPETETDKTGKKPSTPLKNRLRGTAGKGKGKGKANPGVSSLATTVLHEESDTATTPLEEPSGSSTNAATTTEAKKGKSFWSLPTPGARGAPSWTSFTSTPSATPAAGRASGAGSSAGTPGADGYFTSDPANSSSVSLGTSRNNEPILTQAGVTAQAPGLGALVTAKAEAEAEIEHGEGHASDDDASDEAGSAGSTGVSSQDHPSSEGPLSEPAQAARPAPGPSPLASSSRPSFYSRPSRSMVDLATASVPTTGAQLETIRSREPAPGKIEMPTKSPISALQHMMSPNSEWAKPPPTPAAGRAGFLWSKTKEGKEIGTLKRRRSMDDLMSTPPIYEPPQPGTFIPRPRDEEGKEKLPQYWCAVHIEGNLSRKMEFASPGVQSRDRSWKKHYFILRGTSLSVYRFDPHRFPLKVEPAQPIPTVTEEDSEEYLHVHICAERKAHNTAASPPGGRRGSLPDTSAVSGRRGSLPGSSSTSIDGARRSSVASSIGAASISSGSSEKDPSLFGKTKTNAPAPVTHHVGSNSIASHFQQNQLVKQYTLQNAESGLAADYVKRKNVVRVRAEGEQFLLQTESAREVVDWIEAFQAATNVALDLDTRPMPKIITLPRRRRRRPGAPGAAGAPVTAAAVGANPATEDTPEGNAAAVAAAERAAREREGRDRDRMLSEDQAARQHAA